MPQARQKKIGEAHEPASTSQEISAPAQEVIPEEKYDITFKLDPNNAMDEINISMKMTASEITALMTGQQMFFQLPERYSKHLGIFDTGEAVFQSIYSVQQVRIKNWPTKGPEE